MAPKEPYKVHSLNKHIENTKKGLSAEAQFNRRPGNHAASIKKESSDPNNIFANNNGDDDDESESGSDSDSSSDGPARFISKLNSTAKPASATPRRRSKDDEIADSDAERNASKKSTVVKKPAPAKSKPQSSSDSSSEDESDDEKTNVKTNGTTPAKASESTSSSSESGSDSNSDEEDDKAPKPSTKKQQDSASTSDSSSEDESEDEADAKVKPALNRKAATTSDSSSEDSDSESEDEEQDVTVAAKPAVKPVAPEPDSSSSEEEDSDDEMVDESMHIEDREGQLALPNFIAPDFVLRKGDDSTNGRDVAEICNKANLEGKQFWYFTVPSNVPISVVQNLEIPMNQSQSTDKLFSHNGEDYGVSFESIAPKGNIQIMIPSDRPQYQPATKQIDQVMQVKKITQLGSTNSVAPVPKPAPRAQPAGLKARYQPIGVNEPMGSIGDDEDVEMGDAPVLSTKAVKKEKKRKSKETSDKKQKKGQSIPEPPSSRTTEAPTSDARKNKRKLAASEDDAVAVAEQLQEEAKLAASKSKKQKTTRDGSPDLGSEPTSAAAKKYTPVLPPAIPAVGTPTPKSAPTAVTSNKKQKKVKEASVPAPRQSVVPIPSIPHSSPPRSSPARAPASQPPASPSQDKEKRARKRKDKDGKKTLSGKKETPVVPPVPLSSSE